MKRRTPITLVALMAVACGPDPGPAPDTGDTAILVDAGPDAPSVVDATTAPDDGSEPDAFADADLGTAVTCEVNGRAGVCIDVAACVAPQAPTPGFCPGPSEIQCCTDVPAGTCDPAAMPRPNDGLTEAPGVGGCPAGMTPVESFCVDVYEASLVEVDSGTTWSPYFNPGVARVRAVSIAAAIPQGYINGDQAGAACAEAGKRLCTDTEWLRACQSSAGFTYPYGDTRMDGVCNDARAQHPAVEYFMSSDPSVFSMIDHPCLNQLADGLAPTGSNTGCVTSDGAFDMMGNLHEWTADPAGTFRGGFYVDTRLNGPGCLYRTTAHDTRHWDYSTGFRCCADP